MADQKKADDSKRDVVDIVVRYGSAALLAAALGYLAGKYFAQGDEPDPDDRPPIIVSSGGSIHLYDIDALPDGKFLQNTKGDPAGTYSYWHKTKGNPVRLLVSVTGGTNAKSTDSCTNDEIRSTGVTVHYSTKSAADLYFTAEINSRNDTNANELDFDPKGSAVTLVSDHELALYADDKTARLTYVVIGRPKTTDATCTFLPSATYPESIKIMQRKNQ